MVPEKCGACEGTGNDTRFDPDDMELCQACNGKGWLFITETTTEPIPAVPAYGTQSGYQCVTCKQWVTYGTVHYCVGFIASHAVPAPRDTEHE